MLGTRSHVAKAAMGKNKIAFRCMDATAAAGRITIKPRKKHWRPSRGSLVWDLSLGVRHHRRPADLIQRSGRSMTVAKGKTPSPKNASIAAAARGALPRGTR